MLFFTYSSTKLYDTNISWLLSAINWIHRHTFNPFLYFIGDVWYNLIKRINSLSKIFINGDTFSIATEKMDNHYSVTNPYLNSFSKVVASAFLVDNRLRFKHQKISY
jgi:hypothetical protein